MYYSMNNMYDTYKHIHQSSNLILNLLTLSKQKSIFENDVQNTTTTHKTEYMLRVWIDTEFVVSMYYRWWWWRCGR